MFNFFTFSQPPIVEWHNIHDTWPKVFSYLDTQSLLNASLVCKSFNDYLSTLDVLKKLKVFLIFPQFKEDFEASAAIIKKLQNRRHLTRNYKMLEIDKLQDFFLGIKTHEKGSEDSRSNLMRTFFKLSQSVETLILKNCNIRQKNLMYTLRSFVNVRELVMDDVEFSAKYPPIEYSNVNICLPKLKTLRLSKCDFFCLVIFKSHDNLECIELSNLINVKTDMEILENFLLQQKNLKKLKLQNICLKKSLAFVPFQLTSLNLSPVTWETSGHFKQFAKSQKSLKSLTLKLSYRKVPPEETGLPLILQTLLKENPRLESFSFESVLHADMNNLDLLGGIVVPNITQLSFNARDKNSRIFDDFTQAFTNIKCLKYYNYCEEHHDQIQHMDRFCELEEFWLVGQPADLRNAKIGSNRLKTFKYWGINEKKASTVLAEFIAQNPNISDLSLFIEPITFEQICEILMSISSTLEVFCCSDLHLDPPETEIINQKFPRLRKLMSDFVLPQHIIEILNTKDIKFEKFES